MVRAITRKRREWMRQRLDEMKARGAWRADAIHFELNVTYRCNRKCKWCNRLANTDYIQDGDIALDQVERLCAEIVRKKLHISRFKVAGGEPLLHPRFNEIVRILDGLPSQNVQKFWVLSNGVLPMPVLPDRFRPRISPLNTKDHDPNWLSPQDFPWLEVPQPHGTKDDPCVIMKKCGSCFEAWGFCVCAAAGALARIFRVNVYHDEPQFECPDEIRKHCVWAAPRSWRERLWEMGVTGELDHPSKSFREGFERLDEEPIAFERF